MMEILAVKPNYLDELISFHPQEFEPYFQNDIPKSQS